jgi:hypothetical protein
LQAGQHFFAAQIFMASASRYGYRALSTLASRDSLSSTRSNTSWQYVFTAPGLGKSSVQRARCSDHVGVEQVVAARQQGVIHGVGRVARRGFAQDVPLGKPGDVRQLPQGRIELRMAGQHALHHVQPGGHITIEQGQGGLARGHQRLGQLLRAGVAKRSVD